MSEHPIPGEIFEQRYDIIERLGSGGVGTVFKARQIDADRLIALKLLHKEIAADPDMKARFIREAKALNELQHEHIVSVYHLGETQSGIPYLAMEYIQGISLRNKIMEGPLDLERAVTIAVQICDALAYMHSCGIIHRDLKPDNLVLVQPSNSDFIKIIDFGMVRFENPDTQQKLTRTGTVVGTVEYMSPEICRGLPADARSDIYSLGVCLYEMITGVMPYTSTSPVELMYKHVHAAIPQLQNSGNNKLMNEVFRKGLAKEADERFQNALEMKCALESLLGLEPEQAIAVAGRKPKKGWLFPAVVLLLLLGIVCGAISFLKQSTNNKGLSRA